jgi:6-pyruvoyltetrahydropterin/6-carboxytetrahydropterin synthase
MPKYYSTKTFGTDRGFSCCFRQPAATHSHCSLLHGYSLGFKFVFEADQLDHRNWVWDFGNTGWVKDWIEKNFDHTVAVDVDDPHYQDLFELQKSTGILRLVPMKGVGCEKFAEHTYNFVASKVQADSHGRVRLVSVEVFEHGANSAVYAG